MKIDNFISEFIKKEQIKVFEIFEKRDILKKLIRYLKEVKKIKYTNIMKKLDITKGTMERLKKLSKKMTLKNDDFLLRP